MNNAHYAHKPVLLNEVMQALRIQAEGCYVDCTFGRGGHSRAILERLGEHGRLIAIDKDPEAATGLDEQLRTGQRFALVHGPYTMLKEIVQKRNLLHKINGVLFDLGVSSPLLDNPLRGFSFTHDGPLDMRMDNSRGMTAAEWLMSADEKDIARVLKTYGEEKFARKIARAVVAKRAEAAIATTRQLADLIMQAVPVRERDKHPATRSFQAIRIFINHELEELQEALVQALDVMAAGGRLAVISFHSLEDRIVKRFIRDQSRGDYFPPEIPVTGALLKPALKKIGKAVRPGSTEIDLNPRARSAILRVAEKIAT